MICLLPLVRRDYRSWFFTARILDASWWWNPGDKSVPPPTLLPQLLTHSQASPNLGSSRLSQLPFMGLCQFTAFASVADLGCYSLGLGISRFWVSLCFEILVLWWVHKKLLVLTLFTFVVAVVAIVRKSDSSHISDENKVSSLHLRLHQ